MALRTRHTTEGIGQPGRNREDQHHFKEIRERRGILKRVRAIGVEKAAAVSSELLHDFL